MALTGEQAYALSKKYTSDSIAGAGAVAGKPCQIDSVTPITGGNRVTFLWEDNAGTSHTSTMDVMDGADGQDGVKGDKGDTGDTGKGIKAVTVNAEDHLIVTYTDDTTTDAGQIQITAAVDSVNGKTGTVVLTASDVGALPDDTAIPSKTSDLTNDSNFAVDANYIHTDNNYDDTDKAKVAAAISKSVNDLINYYLKSETYTKTEVDSIATAIKNSRFEVVASLPTTDIKTNVIYLVPKNPTQTQNVKDEYINLDGTSAGWEKIGDTEIDLSGYVTTIALNTALTAYTTTTDLTALLADKVDKVTGKGLSTNDYTNTDKELVDSIPTLAPISLVKDAVGWTGKNLLSKSAIGKTETGITFTVNADKSVTINGTATANTFLRFGSENNAFTLEGDESYTLSSGIVLPTGVVLAIRQASTTTNIFRIEAGNKDNTRTLSNAEVVFGYLLVTEGTTVSNVTVYPMLRRADIIDDTYEPYHESVEVMYEEEIHGVNLLKVNATSKTIDGITYTFNPNNSVTLNGTSTHAYAQYDLAYRYIATFTGMVRLNGGLSANIHLYPWDLTRGARPYKDSSKTELQTGIQYNSNGDMLFYVEKGNSYIVNPRVSENGTTVSNATMYPMLRKADIEDSTYRPYNEQAIQNQINDKGVLGAKNLLQVKATSTTLSGVTFTVNEDGSVSTSGTSTASAWFNINGSIEGSQSFINSLKKGVPYIYSGTPSNAPSGAEMTMWDEIDLCPRINAGQEQVFSISSDYVQGNRTNLSIGCSNAGISFDNLTFYPMIRLASDPDDTYQPYAMTNKELTEKIKTIVSETITEAFSAHATKWHDNANDCNVGFERTNNNRTSNMPTTGTESTPVWYNIMTVRESNDSTSVNWGYGFQIAVQTTTNSTMGDIYVRAVNGGATPTWSEWKKLN